MLTVNGWILHLIFTPCSSVPLLWVGPCLHLTLCLSPLLTTPFISMAFLILCSCCLLTTWKCVPLLDLLLCAGRNGLPPTPDTLHLGPSYCLHPSHPFVSTWVAVNARKKEVDLSLSDHHIRSSARPHLNWLYYKCTIGCQCQQETGKIVRAVKG